jgi:hypothetical protein
MRDTRMTEDGRDRQGAITRGINWTNIHRDETNRDVERGAERGKRRRPA